MNKIFICYDRCPTGTDPVVWAADQAALRYCIDVTGWSVRVDDSAWVVVFTK